MSASSRAARMPKDCRVATFLYTYELRPLTVHDPYPERATMSAMATSAIATSHKT